MMRAYRLLLRLYPASFRQEYRAELCGLFAQRRRDARGILAVLALWLDTIIETVGNAAAVHWDVLRQDLRHTVRALGRAPGFALTAIVVTAMGIGANTAAFSVADFVLIRPLPFANPDRLVTLFERTPGYSTLELSPPNYRDWRAMSTTFEAMGAYHQLSVNLVGAGEPQRLEGAAVTGDLLPTLGVRPTIGRLFSADEDRTGAPALLLSNGLWRGQFGADPAAIGKSVTLDGRSYVIVGVMPRGFSFPDRNVTLWTPMRADEVSDDDRSNNWFNVVARVRPGVTLEQARADLARVTAQLTRDHPKELDQTGASVLALRDMYSSQARMLLLVLCGAAVCVLLVACANLANLLLARAQARQRELAVRAALGAGRERLVRQLVTESLVLALLGGGLGVAIAVVAVPLLTRLVPDSLPLAAVPTVDIRVLLVAGLLTIGTGIAFGVIPALQASGNADLQALRDGVRAGGGRRERLRSMLVVAEVMSSVVLLVCAGLLMRAVWRIQAVDPGFRSDSVMTMRTSLPAERYAITANRTQFYDKVLNAVRAMPGVKNAAYASYLPMAMGGGIWPVGVAGEPAQQRNGDNTASMRFVTPGYFATMHIPVRRGRELNETDTPTSTATAVVSESFVKRHWPGVDPIGRQFKFGLGERTVVGVAADVRVRGPERVAEPQVYLPYQQVPDSSLTGYTPKDLAILSSLPAASLIPSVRRIIHAADAEVPISNVRTMAEIVAGTTASRNVQVRILGAFAAIAILLAGVGIHGLLAYSVSQRRREFGVRIALGATRANVLGLVLRQGAWLALSGIIPGIAVAYGAGRLLASLLAGIQPGDLLTFGVAVTLCAAMTLLGSLPPVLRAVRVDPNIVMRDE